MTCIVAQKTETGVLVGADGAISVGSRLIRRETPKIVNVSPRIVVGCAGLSLVGDIVRTAKWPAVTDRPEDERERILGEFFRGLLKDGPKDASFWGVVAADREIYAVSTGGTVARVGASCFAQGSADLVALGALFALDRVVRAADVGLGHELPDVEQARLRLTIALDAAAEHVEGIRPPWFFAETVAP